MNDIPTINVGASTTNAYTYTTSSIVKNCSTCQHGYVCKYREKTEQAIQKMKLPLEIDNIKINVECDHYLGQVYNYPIWYNTNDNSYKPPYEVTCNCDNKEVTESIMGHLRGNE